MSLETVSQIKIQVKIASILGTKLDEKANCFKPVKFNISANLEELGRGHDNALLKFSFIIITEPKVVKYQIEGRTDMQGNMEQIKKILAPNQTTKVPMILTDIYQQVYTQIFVLSKVIDAPCPSPDLLSAGQPMTSREKEMSSEMSEEVSIQVPDENVSEVAEESLPEEIQQPRKKIARKSKAKVQEESLPEVEDGPDDRDVEIPVSSE